MLFNVILIVFSLIVAVSLMAEECFDSVSFIVDRDSNPRQNISEGYSNRVVAQRADTVSNEINATDIIAENQTIPVLQMGCFKNLPELRHIQLIHCHLSDIERSAFLNLPKIKVIKINFNTIPVIREGVFHSLGLVKLSLMSNRIEEVEQHAFYNLTYLEVLDLSLNNLYSLKPDIFFKTNNLRQINLSNNKILFIYDFFFWDCYAPTEEYNSLIDLSYNNISKIERNNFKGVFYVDSLLLNGNNIRNIDPNAFNDLCSGNTLDLTGNNLQKVPNIKLFGAFEEVLFDEEPPKQIFKDIRSLPKPITNVTTETPNGTLVTTEIQNDTLVTIDNQNETLTVSTTQQTL